MAAAALVGGGTGLAALLRTRGQNLKDRADSNQSNAVAIASLTDTISELSARMTAQREANEEAMDELRAQMQSDIEAKDIRIGHLEAHIARLNAESIARDKKYDVMQAYTEGVIASYMTLDAQLRANHITPAAQLPPKPDTGPLK